MSMGRRRRIYSYLQRAKVKRQMRRRERREAKLHVCRSWPA